MDRYFVYIFFDTRIKEPIIIDGVLYNFKPIYIGKGTGSRDKAHFNLIKNKIKNGKKLTLFQKKLLVMLDDGNIPLVIKHKNGLSSNTALFIESSIINQLKTISENGILYNIVKIGTHGNTNRRFDTEWRDKLSLAKIGDRNPMKLKINKDKISKYRKNKKHTETTKKKISEKTKGINNPNFGNCKIIIQKTFEGNIVRIWDKGTRNIEQETKINQSNIIQACLGKRKTAGGYIWEYAK